MKNSTALKIALVIDDSLDRPDGVQQYVKSLGGYLTSQGHTVHYLAGESKTVANIHSLSKNVSVRFNKNRLTVPMPAHKADIKNLLQREKYDVLHVQMPYSPFMAGMVIAAVPATTAVVGTFHILPFGRLQRAGSTALGVVQKRSLRRFNAICSVSPAAAAFAKSHFGIGSVVIPNMVDIAAYRSPLHLHPGRIVFLGRLVPRKGCQQLLTALKILRERSDLAHVEVLIAGSGPARAKLEQYALRHKLPAVFLGFVAEDDKADLLASAELAVFPSLGGESFGIVLLEAMAAGAGVVLGGNNPGYASVLGNWPDTLVNPADAASFALTLEHFLANKPARNVVHNQQQAAVKQYDVAVVGTQVLAMYRSALLQTRGDVR